MFGGNKKQTAQTAHAKAPFIDENLVDIGGALNVDSLLKHYREGSFPWTVHPVTWWSPDPRTVLELDNFRVSRSLVKLLRKGRFKVTIDQAFPAVIQGCAVAPNRGASWIAPEFIRAYTDLHLAGHAHSVEIWENGMLAGGLYGVGLGGYFGAESMFHSVSNASKAALFYLTRHLKARGYRLLDVQMPTNITLQLGATVIPRDLFLKRLREAQKAPVTFGTELETPAMNEG